MALPLQTVRDIEEAHADMAIRSATRAWFSVDVSRHGEKMASSDRIIFLHVAR